MTRRFLHLTLTPDVLEAQKRAYGRHLNPPPASAEDRLGPEEIAFIEARDSFYLATVNKDGWPYIQHRGGPAGFLKVLGPSELAFADLGGNRQLLTTGNLQNEDRVCLFLMSYPQQARLKLLGRAKVLEARDNPDLALKLHPPGRKGSVERLYRIAVEAFDWNCPQHITPRFTEAELSEGVHRLRARIAELEEEVEALKQPPPPE
jgi:uncharacterized protein